MYYAVIGTQDDYEASLCVMEGYIPAFFKGAVQILNEMGKKQEQRKNKEIWEKYPSKNFRTNRTKRFGTRLMNETPNKKELSEMARSTLAASMTEEYEFFDFVKQRLQLQKQSLIKQNFHCIGASME